MNLIGSFKDVGKKMFEILKPKIILGISSDGKLMTLYKCFEKKTSLSIPGFLTSSFHVNLVFVGAHFLRPEDVEFKSVSVRYLCLDEWVNISGFIVEPSKKGEILIRYNSPESVQADICDGLKVSIDFRAKGSAFSVPEKEVTIKQETWFKIETSEAKSFEYYQDIINKTGILLSLAIGIPVYPLAIEGLTEANAVTLRDEKTYYPTVEVFYKLSHVPKEHKSLLPFDMLFTYKDISNRFGTLLRNWFEKMDLLEPVYNLYFATLWNPRMYLEDRFLSLVRAIESFHRRIYGGKYLTDEDYGGVYDSLTAAIPGGISSELKERLKEYLKYGNEFSLRKRLKEIFDKYQVLNEFIENRDGFVEKVVNTRNYLTHYDKDLEKQAAKGEELYYLTEKIKLCVEVLLFTELGFTLDEVKAFFKKRISTDEVYIS